jgi:hypothetical protein
MYYDPERVRAGGPSQFITPPGETWAQLSQRVLSPASRFRLRLLQADLGNFSLLQHRNRADGFLVTAKHSGSQWLKYMLSVGIAHQHNVPPPKYATGPQADDIIGHPARLRRYANLPRIATSHTMPSALMRYVPAGRAPITILVRNIEPALLAGYRKWQGHYDTLAENPRAAFAAGDPGGRRYIADAWWYVHFFNRWGAWAKADPARIQIVRYEDLCADPKMTLVRISAHLRLAWERASLDAALAFVSPGSIQALQDPEAVDRVFSPPESAAGLFSEQDRVAMREILRRHLRHDFGFEISAPVGFE